MTAKIQGNVGFIGSSRKGQNLAVSGMADTTSHRHYLKTLPAIEVYGVTGSGTHAQHSSTQVTGTISLGTAYANREIYIVVPYMAQSSGGIAVSSISLGTTSLTKVFETTTNTDTNACSVAFYKYRDDGLLGTSSTYTVNFNANSVHAGVIAFVTGSTVTTVDTYGSVNNVSGSYGSAGSVSTSVGGFIIYGAIGQNASSTGPSSVTGYTYGTAFDAGSNEYVVVAYQEELTGSTVTVPAPNNSTGTQSAFAAISMG